MAKKPAKRSKAKRSREQAMPRKPPPQERYRQQFAALDGIVLSNAPGITWAEFNDTLRSAIDTDASSYASVVDTELRLRGWPDGGADIRLVCEHVRMAVELGFRMALSRYREHLENVPELQRRKATAAASSHIANEGKRKARVVVGDKSMTRDERDAEMVAEYERLLQLPMKHTPACQRLAQRYEYESWQGVAHAIKQFRKRAGR
ncbi:MAG: hypothetical protein FJ275_04095 [Planctomycetes bacterium]|nr:hypothetical protein [Planctomycetota bacterium]MBM4057404.1 hypothetical protein [Planctomycetota bacterium]